MAKKRFLRDNVLSTMLDDIQKISDRIDSDSTFSFTFQNSIFSIAEMYQTNRVVLERLEQAIELLREEKVCPEALDRIVEGAAHIQLGLITVHNSVHEDIDNIHNSVQELKKAIDSKIPEVG